MAAWEEINILVILISKSIRAYVSPRKMNKLCCMFVAGRYVNNISIAVFLQYPSFGYVYPSLSITHGVALGNGSIWSQMEDVGHGRFQDGVCKNVILYRVVHVC